LYPDRVQIEADEGPMSAPLPLPLPLPGQLPHLDALPALVVAAPEPAEPKKKGKRRFLLLLLVAALSGLGYAATQGMLPL